MEPGASSARETYENEPKKLWYATLGSEVAYHSFGPKMALNEPRYAT